MILIFCFVAFFGWLNWQLNKRKSFKELIEPQLKRFGMQYIKSEYPGIFKVGPFKKIEIEIGKLQINNGTTQYEKTYYRKVTVLTKNKSKVEIWAKIETGWFKDDSVEFSPKLNNIK